MLLFLSTFGVKIDVKNKRKRVSRMCENAYLSIKNPKASRALKRALDPSHKMLTSLARLRFATSELSASEAGAPLDQILDPHLRFPPALSPACKVQCEELVRSYTCDEGLTKWIQD